MDLTGIIGLGAAVLTTIANIPQAYKIVKDKSTKSISLTMFIVLLSGTSLWVWYGVMKDDIPIILANTISSLSSTVIIILKLSSKKTIETIHDKVIPKTEANKK